MFVLDFELTMPTWLKRGAINALLKLGYHNLGKWIHKKIMPKHFTPAGAREYHYRKRDSGHVFSRKACADAHLPLVHTGETRASVLGPR
ncbi:MAG: hypothetical protein ACYS9X_31990, partial [Planctomycetota bacterium]